jgi:hypothetical protein
MVCGKGVVLVVVVVVLDFASFKTVVTDSKRTITVLCDDGAGARVMDSSWKKSNGGW